MMSEDQSHSVAGEIVASPRLTVVGLIEDVLDANQALADLKKAEIAPETISLVVRENGVDSAGESNGASAVAAALAATELHQAGEWLLHLLSLVIPRHGAFLVAGPIGAIIGSFESTIRREVAEQELESRQNAEAGVDEPWPIAGALVHFGYGVDEAGYLAKRVHAGSILIALTTPASSRATEARRIFVDRNAVHIGTNWTEPDAAQQADLLIRTPLQPGRDDDEDEVVVLDSVALLVGLCARKDSNTARRYHHAPVIDSHGAPAGMIEDLLAEVIPDDANTETVHIRYVVIGFGGLLGIGKARVAVPADCVLLDNDPIELTLDARTVQRAPPYQANKPFSRLDEELICAYFDCPQYWLAPPESREE